MSILLAIIYPLAVQIERKGWWYLLAPVTIFALVIDVIANYTELALMTWDFPRRGEHTFSTRLLRLKHDAGWRGFCARLIAKYLNYFSPSGSHV